jgi:hypothetical protein
MRYVIVEHPNENRFEIFKEDVDKIIHRSILYYNDMESMVHDALTRTHSQMYLLSDEHTEYFEDINLVLNAMNHAKTILITSTERLHLLAL